MSTDVDRLIGDDYRRLCAEIWCLCLVCSAPLRRLPCKYFTSTYRLPDGRVVPYALCAWCYVEEVEQGVLDGPDWYDFADEADSV